MRRAPSREEGWSAAPQLLVEALTDEDVATRVEALRGLVQAHLADARVVRALLGLVSDDTPLPDHEATLDPWDSVHLPECEVPPPPTLHDLALERLAELELPGTRNTAEALAEVLRSPLPGWHWGRMSGLVARVRWNDPVQALLQLAPLLVDQGHDLSPVVEIAPAEVLRVLCERAIGPPLDEPLMARLAAHAAPALLRSLRRAVEEGGRAEADLLPFVHRAIARTDGRKATEGLRVLELLEDDLPLAMGFAALWSRPAGERFRAWLADSPQGDPGPLLAALDDFERVPAGFPLGPFLVWADAGWSVVDKLGAERDPEVQAALLDEVRVWSDRQGWEALLLLIRGGAHASDPDLAQRALAALDRGDTPSWLQRSLLELAQARPPLRGLLPRLFELAESRPTWLGFVAPAIEAASRAGQDGDLSAFLDRYLGICEEAPVEVVPGKVGRFEVRAGCEPLRLLPLLQLAEVDEGVLDRWRAVCPRPLDTPLTSLARSGPAEE